MSLWCKLTGAVLISCLLITGCSSKPSEVAPPVQEEAAEEGQVITIENPEALAEPTSANKSVNMEEGKRYQIQTRLTDFHLLSESAGIAWGSTRSELRLYLTQNSGKTWTSISPAASVQFPYHPKYNRDIFFIDASHGWIVRNPVGSSDAIVLRTQDGGATWKIASLPGSDKVEAIYFADHTHGWILAARSYPDKEEKSLYQTQDGGATWSKIMSSPSMADASQDHMLPSTGSEISMVFRDRLHGYVSMINSGIPKLYVTDNGGVSWSEIKEFFSTAKYKSCERFVAGELQFFANETLSGWIPIGCVKEGSTKFNGYYTADNGASWRLAPFESFWQSGLNESLPPSFISSGEGWLYFQSQIYHTLDQGKSWTALPESKVLTEILAEYPEIVKLEFSSDQVGWLLAAQSNQKRSLLLQTLDGGISWRVL
ncbi:WD40/YVTN/BNR-like repeat-containing protein [Paenibacillus ihumii]|uniref:WD40/YVTN/BNR-like repeat-containing protein n=1 Tax=Paenibacillus ihumii TaxID=687436 RepID=UPI0006D7D04A|nr:YCF48-related protein [Paenibacillus ihumii]